MGKGAKVLGVVWGARFHTIAISMHVAMGSW